MTKPVNHSSTPWLLFGGGALAIGGALLARHKSTSTTEDVQRALASGTATPMPDDGSDASRGIVTLKLTCYWPFTASDDEKKMEGKPEDAAGAALHTVEDFFAGKSDFVSLAGDLQGHKGTVWPYGQKVLIPWGDGRTIVGRVVDTGGHFHGANKLYRVLGAEPIDICVYDRNTKPVKTTVQAKIVSGDNFVKGRAVATGDLKGQNVVAGEGAVQEGRTIEDYDALARAIESNFGGRPEEEMRAAAWAIRNRADLASRTVYDLLCPSGQYGAPSETEGYASTRREPTERSRHMAAAVLDAPQMSDPTGGAVDYWVPEQQTKLNQLGDVYRAAVASGDEGRARKYKRYARYGTEGEIRVQHARSGLKPLARVGGVELLGRMS